MNKFYIFIYILKLLNIKLYNKFFLLFYILKLLIYNILKKINKVLTKKLNFY